MVLPAVKQWSTERIQACLLADPPCRRVRQRATTRRGGRVRPQLLIHCRHRSSPVASPVSLTLEAAKAVLRSSAVVRRAHISSRHSGRMDRTAAFPRCDASDQPNEGQLEWRAADEMEHVAADLLDALRELGRQRLAEPSTSEQAAGSETRSRYTPSRAFRRSDFRLVVQLAGASIPGAFDGQRSGVLVPFRSRPALTRQSGASRCANRVQRTGWILMADLTRMIWQP
jgi:hypothetical protein